VPKISIIDDDASDRTYIELALNSHGHVAVSSPNAKHFIPTADVNNLDCFIVEDDMPQMTGLELHEWLQEQTVLKAKFVFLTGRIS